MRRFLKAFTITTFFLFLLALGSAGFVLAQTGYTPDRTTMPNQANFVDWATVASALAAVLLLLVGACLAHINSQITKLSDTLWARVVDNEQQLETLHRTLLRDYHTKPELREMLSITMRPLMEKLTSLSGDMDAVYRELLRANKRSGDTNNEHPQKSNS